jgi:phytoene dehydrogenase-like protein
MQHDAVVIGAGHNGLAAAVHLSSLGWDVAVLEAASEPGGAVKTREITLPGFRHDLYAMNVGMFAGSPFFAAHKARLIEAGIAFAGASDCFATAFADRSWLGISQDLATTSGRIAAFSEKDAARWRALAQDFPGQAPHIFGLPCPREPPRR